jgi:hypothetical protein
MDFLTRFNIEINKETSERKFLNRVDVFMEGLITKIFEKYGYEVYEKIAYKIGVQNYNIYLHINQFYKNDLSNCLHVIEIVYVYLLENSDENARDINNFLKEIMSFDDFTLNIEWRDSKFYPQKLDLLDDELINISLNWLSSNTSYKSVYTAIAKGLDLFIKSKNDSRLLSDVITDMYEALESFAKIITGRDKDLSSNGELLIKKLNVSDNYKGILKEYVRYANEFRHGSINDKSNLKSYEVESFVYLTGLFIRLGIESLKDKMN